jgi:hypothetical protein
MSEEIVAKAAEEIKNADEDKLTETIEAWYEKIHTIGLKTGASYISSVIYGAYQKHVGTKQNPSLRDYKRMTEFIVEVVSRQLQRQNDETQEVESEEKTNE